MEARKIHAKNQIVMDLTPGTIAVIASPYEWREVIKNLGYANGGTPDEMINQLIDQGVYDQ
jgi:hypothetical protein